MPRALFLTCCFRRCCSSCTTIQYNLYWFRILCLYNVCLCRGILDNAAEEKTPGDWRTSGHGQLLASFMSKAVRATAMYLRLADGHPTEHVLQWVKWQDLGQLYVNMVQGCTPLYDSMVSACSACECTFQHMCVAPGSKRKLRHLPGIHRSCVVS